MNGGIRYLLKNIGLLTISNFTTKLLSFFLVPLYTNVLSTGEYGTYDFFNTTIGLLIPILTLDIMDSVLRFSLDEKIPEDQVFSIGLFYLLRGILPVILLIILNNMLNWNSYLEKYWVYFLLMYVVNAFVGFITCFVRGIDRVSTLSISGVISSFITIILNIIFLLPFKLGISGYFLANILGALVQWLYLFVTINGFKYIRFKKLDINLKKQMTDYSKPLIANSIAWWINNASDRYIVIWLCGISANGIYSVGYKIPTILNIFQQIFNQAWTLSAVKEFDPEDSDGFFANMYNSYNLMMVIVCSLIIILNKFIANFLYAKDFFLAWKYVPFLTIAIVFGALSGYIGGIFSAVKNSKIFAQSTIIGAISNVILNIILVYWFGPVGASIATAVSFWIVWAIRIQHLKKYMRIQLNLIRDYISYALLVVQSLTFLLLRLSTTVLYFSEIVIFIIIILLYLKELKQITLKIKEKL